MNRPSNVYTRFHLQEWTESDFAKHGQATRDTVSYMLELEQYLATLTKPRPRAEYHEDMGSVLWWCWKETREIRGGELCIDRKWLGEPPYVGTPNDMGFTVEIETEVKSSTNVQLVDGNSMQRLMVGGWPGYHTHFTLLPPMPAIP